MPIAPADRPAREALERALAVAEEKIDRLVTADPGFYPMFTEQGRWRHDRQPWTHWCDGFLPGIMWILAARTNDPRWRDRAIAYTRPLEPRQHDRDVHDLGFLFWSSWRRWHLLEPSDELDRVVITAGQTMSLRLHPRGRYLRSFVAPESTFIDIMMNIGIIFHAAQQLGDAAMLERVRDHCLTTRRFLVRGDGSTAHEGLFDLESGAFVRQSTHQGWRDDSSWARGQGWALYGFGTAYRFSGEPEFLDTAVRCADYFIDNTPDHGVPPNDWWEPNPPYPYESSAAVIGASGLLQLATLVEDDERARRFERAAYRIATTTIAEPFLAADAPDWEGILRHGIYHQRLDLGVDESTMWGDYFFVEMVDKLLGADWAGP